MCQSISFTCARVPIVRWTEHAVEVAKVQWGFVPEWSKESPKLKPINARCETIAKSGMFRNAFNRANSQGK